MAKAATVIWVHQLAPAKPALGQRCNGCGVCCAAEPCPVARLFLWQFQGPCQALMWDQSQQRYFCGLLQQPRTYLRYLPTMLERPFQRYTASRIAADTACDSVAEVGTANQPD